MATILSSTPYFSGLPPEELQAVESLAVRKVYAPGQLVILEGDAEGGLYVVESGWLKAVKISTGGREQVVSLLENGDSFNGVAVFTRSLNQATVIALEESAVWWISRTAMEDLLDKHPRISRLIIQDLADRLQHLIGLVEDISLRSVESRLSRTLLESQVDLTIQRRKWATQAEMASRLGTVPDVLNRALRKMADEGLIEVSRSQIQILDLDALQKRAQAG